MPSKDSYLSKYITCAPPYMPTKFLNKLANLCLLDKSSSFIHHFNKAVPKQFKILILKIIFKKNKQQVYTF